MEKIQIMEKLAEAIVDGDDENAQEGAKQALAQQIDPLEAVEQGLSKGMAAVGDTFERGEVFLPELLMAAQAFKTAMEILQPEIEAQNKQVAKKGKVLIGTVKGDVHNIGKNIVATVLETNGFEVIDIGVDQSPLDIIQEAEKVKADAIALSSLMTTTMPAQKEVVEVLTEMGLREKYVLLVGGGPVTQEWAGQIGADGYGESAVHAVGVVEKLLNLGE